MTKKIKISVLWLLTIGGFACHSICDVLPMFWGKNMAVVATNGNVDQGMIVFMMLISFLFPGGSFGAWITIFLRSNCGIGRQ